MKFVHKILVGVGILLVLFGFVMGLGVIGISVDEKYDYGPVELVIMGCFFFGLPVVAGGLLIRFAVKKGKHVSGEAEERAILQLAASRGGKLTAAEIAVHTEMDSRQAQALMEDLHRRGIADMQVAQGGVIVYAFPGLMSQDEKERALGFDDT